MDRNLASGSSLAPSLRQYSAAAHGPREGRSEIELAHAPHQRKKGLMRSDLGRASCIDRGPVHHLHLVDPDLSLLGMAVGTHPGESPIWQEGVEVRVCLKEGVEIWLARGKSSEASGRIRREWQESCVGRPRQLHS